MRKYSLALSFCTSDTLDDRVNMIQLASMINGCAVAYMNVAVVSIVRCGKLFKGKAVAATDVVVHYDGE